MVFCAKGVQAGVTAAPAPAPARTACSALYEDRTLSIEARFGCRCSAHTIPGLSSRISEDLTLSVETLRDLTLSCEAMWAWG